MHKLPWCVEEFFVQEFKKGDVEVTIKFKSNNHKKESGLTFKKDGYWLGKNKKIHINDYVMQHVNHCNKCTQILINGTDLFKIDPIALPKPE